MIIKCVYNLLIIVALFSLGFVQWDLFNYINKQIELAKHPLTVISSNEGVTDIFYLVDMFPTGESNPQIYLPRFTSLREMQDFQAGIATKQIEKYSPPDADTLRINGIVIEVGEKYVVVRDNNGKDWQIDNDGTVTPIIYTQPDDRQKSTNSN